jgi:hypothetical protein
MKLEAYNVRVLKGAVKRNILKKMQMGRKVKGKR